MKKLTRATSAFLFCLLLLSNTIAQIDVTDGFPSGFPTDDVVNLGDNRYQSATFGTFSLDTSVENKVIHDVLGPFIWNYDPLTKIVTLETEWYWTLRTSLPTESSSLGFAFPYVISDLYNTIYLVDVSGASTTPFFNHGQNPDGSFIGWQSAIGLNLWDAQNNYLQAEALVVQMQQASAELGVIKAQLEAMQVAVGSNNIELKREEAIQKFAQMHSYYQKYIFYFNRGAVAWVFVQQRGGTDAEIALAQAWANALIPLTATAEEAYAAGQTTLFIDIEGSIYPAKVQQREAIQGSSSSFTYITSVFGDPGGHGVMFADVNGDALPDIYYPLNHSSYGSISDKFLINAGNGAFGDQGAARGIADTDGGSHGSVFCDLDHDGDFDLVNGTTFGDGKFNNIFQNNGAGFFTDITPANIQARQDETRGLLAMDMDADGDLDFFGVPRAWIVPSDPMFNEIWINQGNMNFTAVTSGDIYTAPACQGAIDTDFDGDGDIDILSANRSGQVVLLRNNGGLNFSRINPADIGISHDAEDGISAADIDNDGDLDLLLSGSDWNAKYLYLNVGNGIFQLRQHFTGVPGYMGGFADLDNDGDVDIYFAGDDKIYLNNGAGQFTAGPAVPIGSIDDPRGVAFADIDNDGDVDFSVGTKGDSFDPIIRNDSQSTNRWLKVRLISPYGQLGAFGAKVTASFGGKIVGMREARSNQGYLAQDDPTLHFGLGAYSSVTVEVKFLGGKTVTLSNVAANQTITVDGR
ncbi:MAG: CRTAC1 family protein [Opitutales bacterium]|nr:CRTAC1 family protein [Opitutales bacterium]